MKQIRNRNESLVIPALVLLATSIFAARLEAQVQIDVNRPRSPFECDTPIGEQWYGSEERCLQELCAGRNVFNEYIFDANNRRRVNPCYGQSPTEVDE
jgi:hypothetical protein